MNEENNHHIKNDKFAKLTQKLNKLQVKKIIKNTKTKIIFLKIQIKKTDKSK